MLKEISKQYSSLTPVEKKLADYVTQNPSEAVNLSAAALAQRAGTAPSAVIRFCKSLGFEGFPAFKVQLAVSLSRQIPASYMSGATKGDSNSTVLDKIFAANIKALQDTASRIDRNAFSEAVSLLANARNIYIYGLTTSASMVNELQHRLMILGFQCHGFNDIGSMRLSTMNVQPGDVAVGISHSGRTLAILDVLALSKQAGAKTICLTSYSDSPITAVSDLTLSVYCDETLYPVEAASARIAQIGVIDALIAALSVQRYDISVQRSAQIHDLMENIRKKRKNQ